MIYVHQAPKFQLAAPNGDETHSVAVIIFLLPAGMKLT